MLCLDGERGEGSREEGIGCVQLTLLGYFLMGGGKGSRGFFFSKVSKPLNFDSRKLGKFGGRVPHILFFLIVNFTLIMSFYIYFFKSKT